MKENSKVRAQNTKLLVALFTVVFLQFAMAAAVSAQSTEFAFQGSLKDGASPANGNYDFEFRLYDAVTIGNQHPTVVTRTNVAVSNGLFSVKLDFLSFPAGAFPGTDRFLEIRVRNAGGGAYTILDPRQKVGSSPYALQSLNATTATNATQLGGVAAGQYVVTTDPRMTDARNPLPNSPNYIRNSAVQQQTAASLWISGSGNFGGPGNFDGGLSVGGNFVVGGNTTLTGNLTVNGTLTGNLPSGDTSYVQNRTTQQTGTNFNISGSGIIGGSLNASTVSGNIFSAVIVDSTVYRIGGSNVLNNFGTQNIAVGVNAGAAGVDNSFFGFNAGNGIQAGGTDNSFFGSDAGGVNTTGSENSFFGSDTGDSNTTGFNNSFFGRNAGTGNTIGTNNSYFGHSAGQNNLSADSNSFFGFQSGLANTADFNSFFGTNSGRSNTSGNNNSIFGGNAGLANTSGSFNSFFGNNAGDSNSTGGGNSFFGRNAGEATTIGNSNTFIGTAAGVSNTTGSSNTLIGAGSDVGASSLSNATAIGAGTIVTQSNRIQLGRAAGTDWVEIPGRTYSRQRLEVGESGADASLFVYGSTSITGSLNVGGGAAIQGNLSKGGGSFKIDHPLDPKNKYLYHSFVESPDMMNIYNGNATTDENGEAVVTMPGYFEALNRDFRYQLTVIGVFAQAIISEEMNSRKFSIRTDKPCVKVSWQVTGIRHDPYADQNRIQVEVEKSEKERGTYLYPQAYERKADDQ